jgi:hypothetical protein
MGNSNVSNSRRRRFPLYLWGPCINLRCCRGPWRGISRQPSQEARSARWTWSSRTAPGAPAPFNRSAYWPGLVSSQASHRLRLFAAAATPTARALVAAPCKGTTCWLPWQQTTPRQQRSLTSRMTFTCMGPPSQPASSSAGAQPPLSTSCVLHATERLVSSGWCVDPSSCITMPNSGGLGLCPVSRHAVSRPQLQQQVPAPITPQLQQTAIAWVAEACTLSTHACVPQTASSLACKLSCKSHPPPSKHTTP